MKRDQKRDAGTEGCAAQRGVSRRTVLRAAGMVGAAAAAGCTSSTRTNGAHDHVALKQSQTPAWAPPEKASPAVPATTRGFALADLRLLPGPFKNAQERDRRYLLSLEPDRLLHNFRVNAGLAPKAPIYGGWESVATWADIRAHGHTLGHYLSACAMMFASTGDASVKQRIDYIVAELQTCQDAGKTGAINAFPDGLAQIDNAVAGRRIIGVPWYTLHKVMAGLRDAYLHTANAAALVVLTKLAAWAGDVTQAMSDSLFQRMLQVEHGGMNEVLADVYAFTGDARHLTLAERFCDRSLLTPLAEGRDTLDKLHSNTQIPKVIGFQRLYELTGKVEYRKAARFFWETVVGTRSFASGGNGDNEHFFPVTQFAAHVNSPKTMETCCSYNMLKLTRALFTAGPQQGLTDYYERTLYNAILASQDPDSGMMTYFQPLKSGYLKLFCTPTDSFWCCTGSGMENHSKYGDSIYFHSLDNLFVNLFISSTVNWAEKGVTLTQTTSFPDQARTQLRLALAKPAAFTVNLRHPAWCRQATVRVNGKTTAAATTPGGYVTINRTWRNGDLIEMDVPMELHAEPLPGVAGKVALMYGPIVLAGQLGTQGITPGSDLIVNERTYGQMLNETIEVPALKGDVGLALSQVQRDGGEGSPLSFTAAGTTHGNVTLLPYYRTVHTRYIVYWDMQA